MKRIMDLYEQIEKTEIRLCIDEKAKFDYVSKTSIHSEVTDWAYGIPLKRSCVDISDGSPLYGEAEISETNGRFFFKIIACMPKWQKYVNSLTLKVNGTIVYDKQDAFFEQVNLGWPALYIELDKSVLKSGKNEFCVSSSNVSGGGLYVSELSLISYPETENLTQISIRRYVADGAHFGIAVKDNGCLFNGVEKLKNCEFIGASRYKDCCILSFTAAGLGKTACTALFGDKKVNLDMPESVENADGFILGMDSDDHRHDDSDETAFLMETVIFSGMGNFIQFRPQKGRNYFKLVDKKDCERLVGLIDAFGMKYGLCDCNMAMNFLPDIKPENFFGYHIHEPYLFFNPALLDNPREKDKYFCEPNKIIASNSFGESKNLYINVLRQAKETFATDKGLTSLGSPSMLCVYEGNSEIDRITVEPVSNINLLTGAVRATSAKVWGAHVPTDWYFGVPVDVVKSNKYRLAMQYLYLNGADYVYAENSLFKTNAFERCDWESEFCRTNRKYLREFYDYTLTHPRKGKLSVSKAIVYGRNEFFMWKLNDRIAELKEKDWDSQVWGKWDNAYQIVWNAVETWLPASGKQNVYESPLNKNLFSGTPYGNVDVVYAEKEFSKYSHLVFLGWNTMDDELLSRLEDYVKNGGILVISYAHFNYTDRNDEDMVFPCAERLKEFVGIDITGETTVSGKIDFGDECVEITEESIVTGEVLTAETIAHDKDGYGVVYKNGYGKGQVYFIAYNDYVTDEKSVSVFSKVMRIAGEEGDERCDNENVSFTVRETDTEYILSVLNMNCIENADEKFNIDFKGHRVSGEIKVGEIKNFVLKK